MQLAKCPLGVRCRITGIDIDPKYDLRMQELGVREGAQFHAVNRVLLGGVVVNIAGTRVAIDRRSAGRIQVEKVDV